MISKTIPINELKRGEIPKKPQKTLNANNQNTPSNNTTKILANI